MVRIGGHISLMQDFISFLSGVRISLNNNRLDVDDQINSHNHSWQAQTPQEGFQRRKENFLVW